MYNYTHSNSFPHEDDIDKMVQSGRESRDPRHRDRRDRSYQDGSRSREREKDRDRDRDRDRERDRDKDRDRNRDRDRDRRRDRRDGDFNREPPRHRFKDNELREPDPDRNDNYQQVYKIDFKNRPTLFDISPPGYETTPVSEYKHLKSIGALPVMAIPHGSTIILRARRLYVENLPENLKPNDFVDFINNEMRTRNVALKPGNPALALDLGLDGQTAYLEFRTAEETSAALVLDGIDYKGTPVKLTRPTDYQPASGYYFGCPNVFQDTLNKLFVACIPVHLTDDQVRELLCAFGELKAFNLVKDGATGLSKGYAFCEYRDGSVTDIAIAGLNNMPIADKKLVVQRAVLGSRAGTNLGGIIPTQMQVPGVDPDHIISHDLLVTEVLCLINTVTIEDLENPKELEEITEDVKQECSKYGEVVAVEIPPYVSDSPPPFIGRIFVQFVDKESCKEAHECLAGRKFKDRLVLTTFYDLEKFQRKEF